MIKSLLTRLFGERRAVPPTAKPALPVAAEQHRGEIGLRQSEEHFGQLVAGLRDYAVFLLDREGYVLTWNSGAEAIKGYTAEEIVGQHFSRFYPDDALSIGWPDHELAVASTTGRFEDEGWRVRKDGTAFWANVVITALRNESGDVRGFLKITRDLTDRKRAEENARRLLQEEAARQAAEATAFETQQARKEENLQRERFLVTLASIGDGVIVTDDKARVTFLNSVAEELTGWTLADAEGKPLETVFRIVNEQTRQKTENPVDKALREGRIVGLANHTILIAKDATERAIDDSASPIRERDGNVVGVVLVFRDVSEQRAAERRRNARLAITQILARETNIEKAVAEILAAVCSALGWDAGCFWRLQPDEQMLRCQKFWQEPSRDLEEFRIASMQLACPSGENLPGRVWKIGQPVWRPDVAVDPEFGRAPQAKEVGLHGYFACPVTGGDEFLGVVEWFSHEIWEPDDDLLEMMTTIGTQIGQFIDRRESEQKLRRSEEELNDFFENGAVGLHWVGPDGTILRVNRAELDLLGYTHDEYVGRHIAEFHADQPVIDDILRCLTAGEQLHDYEARLRCKDGSIKHVLIDSNVLWEDGRFIHTRCFTRDITERKRMEQSLLFLAEASKALAALVDYRSTLQKVVQLAVPNFADWCAVDMLEADGTVRRLAVAHVDPAKVELAEKLYNRYPPAPDAPRGVMNVLRTGKPELGNRITDSMMVKAAQNDEHLRLLRELNPKSYMSAPLTAKGRTLGVISFVSAESERAYGPDDLAMAADLAHRAAVAIDNARLYHELQEAGRRKNEFLAMLAHELRNPLAPIRSGLDILAMDAGPHRETIQLMQEQVEHVVRLVDDLLDVSRIMQGKVELRKESVELADLINRSVNAVRPLIDSHGQELIVCLPEQSIWLRADPVRIVQVLENLLSNASKYTNAAGRIELSVERQDDQAAIQVTDSGIGIEPELLPKVFELFTQSSRSLDRAQGGLGIGLTLVQRLIKMHGGTVSVQSEGPGRGSTFSVRLPVVDAAAPAKKEREERPPIRRRRILVVDDNMTAARMLVLLLKTLDGHEVETAHDGPSALEKIQEMSPEIVFLDIGLPGTDGYQVARTVREMPEFDDVLLIALTGYGQEDDRQRSREAGFDEHLVKPPSVDQIKFILAHPKLATD